MTLTEIIQDNLTLSNVAAFGLGYSMGLAYDISQPFNIEGVDPIDEPIFPAAAVFVGYEGIKAIGSLILDRIRYGDPFSDDPIESRVARNHLNRDESRQLFKDFVQDLGAYGVGFILGIATKTGIEIGSKFYDMIEPYIPS